MTIVVQMLTCIFQSGYRPLASKDVQINIRPPESQVTLARSTPNLTRSTLCPSENQPELSLTTKHVTAPGEVSLRTAQVRSCPPESGQR